MKVIQLLLTGYLISISASQKKTGDTSTRLFLVSGGAGGIPSGSRSFGHEGSFDRGGSPFVGGGGHQRPFGGGQSGGFLSGGRLPIGGVGSLGSLGTNPYLGEGIEGGLGGRPPIAGGGGLSGDPHVGATSSNCRYWCNQDRGKVYCCEYDTDPLTAVGNKFGKCPPLRPVCPGTKFGPKGCSNDFSCTGIDKCCFDKCLNIAVCKKPVDFLIPDNGFPSGGGIAVEPYGTAIGGDIHSSGTVAGLPGSGFGGGIHRPGIGEGFHGSGIGGGFQGSGIGGSFHGSGFGGGIQRPGIGGGIHGSGIGGGFHGSGIGGGIHGSGVSGGFHGSGIGGGFQGSGFGGGLNRPGISGVHGSGIGSVPHESVGGAFHQGGSGFGGTGGFANVAGFARIKNN